VNVVVVTAGEHAGPPESPVEYPSPDSPVFIDSAGLRLPSLILSPTFRRVTLS
jgi:hypothetical protein